MPYIHTLAKPLSLDEIRQSYPALLQDILANPRFHRLIFKDGNNRDYILLKTLGLFWAWPHKISITIDGKKSVWEFLNNGSYNVVYVNESKTFVLKFLRWPWDEANLLDLPERIVRISPELNKNSSYSIKVVVTNFGRATISNFLENSKENRISVIEIANKQLDDFDETRRIVIDSFVQQTIVDPETGLEEDIFANYMMIKDPVSGKHILNCTDTGCALDLEKSVTSLTYWNAHETLFNNTYDALEKKYASVPLETPSNPTLVIQTTKALLYIQKYYPECDVKKLKNNREVVSQLALAYQEDRQSKHHYRIKFILSNDYCYTTEELCKRSYKGKWAQEIANYLQTKERSRDTAELLFRFFYRGNSFHKERITFGECFLEEYPYPFEQVENIWNILMDCSPPRYFIDKYKLFYSKEASNEFWNLFINPKKDIKTKNDIDEIFNNCKEKFAWHEKLVEELSLLLSTGLVSASKIKNRREARKVISYLSNEIAEMAEIAKRKNVGEPKESCVHVLLQCFKIKNESFFQSITPAISSTEVELPKTVRDLKNFLWLNLQLVIKPSDQKKDNEITQILNDMIAIVLSQTELFNTHERESLTRSSLNRFLAELAIKLPLVVFFSISYSVNRIFNLLSEEYRNTGLHQEQTLFRPPSPVCDVRSYNPCQARLPCLSLKNE